MPNSRAIMLLRLLLLGGLAYVVYRLVQKALAPPPATPREPSPWEVLDVARGASREEIRSAYQAKISQYHPDKVASLGPELQALAERHAKEINAAYEALTGRKAK